MTCIFAAARTTLQEALLPNSSRLRPITSYFSWFNLRGNKHSEQTWEHGSRFYKLKIFLHQIFNQTISKNEFDLQEFL